jgi:tripartite-type tricarboxylate transporter receptor subunit TctC
VRFIVGFAPAGGNDIVARLIGQWLSERLGQTFIIENRPGAATNIATEAVVNAPPDGYTLLLAGTPNASNATLYGNLKFNFIRAIEPVAGVARGPQVLVVNPSVPATTVPEFVAYAKANPGKINMASSGIGGGSHLAGELFKMMTGVNLVHVPYRGNGPALTDLLGGQVDVLFPTLASSIEYIRTGKLRGLAVTTAMRSRRCRTFRPWASLVWGCEMSVAWRGRTKARRPRSSISSTGRSTRRPWSIPMRCNSPIWVTRCSRSRRPACKFIAEETGEGPR